MLLSLDRFQSEGGSWLLRLLNADSGSTLNVLKLPAINLEDALLRVACFFGCVRAQATHVGCLHVAVVSAGFKMPANICTGAASSDCAAERDEHDDASAHVHSSHRVIALSVAAR